MMTRPEIIDLLSVITAYDNRNASPATVLAWGTAAEIGRWTLPEAIAAVHAHFASSSEWLMPAHVTEHIRARRTQPAPVAELAAPDKPAADPQHIRAVVTDLAQRMGWPQEIDRRAVMAETCTHCGAQPQQQCTRPSRVGQQECPPHPTRRAAAARNAS